MKIKHIFAREILDSRGNPTVEAHILLENGLQSSAKVPSGASTGSHEAMELRDGGKRYGGKGVLKAVKNITTKIAQELKGMDILDQKKIDQKMIELDGTKNKSKLGANAILAVSMAAARGGAMCSKIPLYKYIRKLTGFKNWKSFILPVPTMNILNGGVHTRNNLSIQEFMIIPHHKNFSERVRMGAEIFHALQTILVKKHFSIGVGDEGGFSPNILNGSKDNEKAIVLMLEAINAAGYKAGKDVFLGLDLAASEFFKKGFYYFIDQTTPWKGEQLISILKKWVKKYPLLFIEDPLAEDDWVNWKILTKELDKKIYALVGDDLFVTNHERLDRGIRENVANMILIKPNQIGTLTETLETIKIARNNDYGITISHRSGETSDTFIADLAVAVNAEFIKTGSLSRSERVEKYNRLMEIEQELK